MNTRSYKLTGKQVHQDYGEILYQVELSNPRVKQSRLIWLPEPMLEQWGIPIPTATTREKENHEEGAFHVEAQILAGSVTAAYCVD